MTNQEFSDEFDVLYNNITSNQAPGLDEYEKSVFLTKAQDEIVKAYFNPRLNKPQQGFDDTERRQIDFSMLTKIKEDLTLESALFDTHSNSKAVDVPTDALMIINEMVTVTRGSIPEVTLQVLPIQYTEYTRLMSKPFKRPLKWQAWRLINSNTATKGDIVVGNNDTITKYIVRYVKRPRAIILTTLEGVTIDGVNAQQTCELDPILHHEILQRAVELAKAAYTGDLSSQIALGQSSETEKGIVAQSR